MDSNEHPHRRILSGRRLTVLGSAAVIGSAIAFAGPSGYDQYVAKAYAAPISQAQQGPAGFADLDAKVKPAVISVRVKIDQDGDISSLGPNGKNVAPSMENTPLERFFRQY